MKSIIVAFVVVLVLAFSFSISDAWLIYHKPEYRGRIIDAETKAPIEGAVVVVIYYKQFLVGIAESGRVEPLTVKETLTDSKGEFYFPSYNGFILFSRELGADFIIYKPGYMGSSGPVDLNTETFFSADVVGKEGEIRRNYGKPEVWKGPLGVVELTKGDRSTTAPTGYRSDKLPLLFKAFNEDRERRGWKGEEK